MKNFTWRKQVFESLKKAESRRFESDLLEELFKKYISGITKEQMDDISKRVTSSDISEFLTHGGINNKGNMAYEFIRTLANSPNWSTVNSDFLLNKSPNLAIPNILDKIAPSSIQDSVDNRYAFYSNMTGSDNIIHPDIINNVPSETVSILLKGIENERSPHRSSTPLLSALEQYPFNKDHINQIVLNAQHFDLDEFRRLILTNPNFKSEQISELINTRSNTLQDHKNFVEEMIAHPEFDKKIHAHALLDSGFFGTSSNNDGAPKMKWFPKLFESRDPELILKAFTIDQEAAMHFDPDGSVITPQVIQDFVFGADPSKVSDAVLTSNRLTDDAVDYLMAQYLDRDNVHHSVAGTDTLKLIQNNEHALDWFHKNASPELVRTVIDYTNKDTPSELFTDEQLQQVETEHTRNWSAFNNIHAPLSLVERYSDEFLNSSARDAYSDFHMFLDNQERSTSFLINRIPSDTILEGIDGDTSPGVLERIKGHKDIYDDNLSDRLLVGTDYEDPDQNNDSHLAVHPKVEGLKAIKGVLLENNKTSVKKRELQQMGVANIPNEIVTPQGDVSLDSIENHITSLPYKPVGISWGHWEAGSAQMHDDSVDQDVLQVNLSHNMLNELKEQGLLSTFMQVHKNSIYDGHPVTPTSLGWARIDNRGSHAHIDEIQSDFNSALVREMGEAKRQGKEDYLGKLKEIQQITSAGHEDVDHLVFSAAHAALREQGIKSVSMDTPEDQAKQSGLRRDKSIPVHQINTYNKRPKKIGYQNKNKNEVIKSQGTGNRWQDTLSHSDDWYHTGKTVDDMLSDIADCGVIDNSPQDEDTIMEALIEHDPDNYESSDLVHIRQLISAGIQSPEMYKTAYRMTIYDRGNHPNYIPPQANNHTVTSDEPFSLSPWINTGGHRVRALSENLRTDIPPPSVTSTPEEHRDHIKGLIYQSFPKECFFNIDGDDYLHIHKDPNKIIHATPKTVHTHDYDALPNTFEESKWNEDDQVQYLKLIKSLYQKLQILQKNGVKSKQFNKLNKSVARLLQKVSKSRLSWSEDYDDDDLYDAIDHINLKRNRSMSQGLDSDNISTVSDEYSHPDQIMPKTVKDMPRGWLKQYPESEWNSLLSSKIESVKGHDFSHLLKAPQLSSVISINGDIGDGYHRAHLAHALGEQIHIIHMSDSVESEEDEEDLDKSDNDEVWYHGTPSGNLVGGKYGLHLGTRRAAEDALHSRIGIPVDGTWDGSRKYGDVLLAGKKTLIGRGISLTGYNSDAPDEDHYPTGTAKYGDGSIIPHDAKPEISAFKLVGAMSNARHTPHDDFKANGYMAAQIKKGVAKRGYYYTNIAEDSGSISIVVPSAGHVRKIDAEDDIKKSKLIKTLKRKVKQLRKAIDSKSHDKINFEHSLMDNYIMSDHQRFYKDHNKEKVLHDLMQHPNTFNHDEFDEKGISIKGIYKLPDKTVMIKPFHKLAEDGTQDIGKHPMFGFSTMLYKDMCRQANADHICENVGMGRLKKRNQEGYQPVTVHEFNREYKPAVRTDFKVRDPQDKPTLFDYMMPKHHWEQVSHDAHKIAMLDYLTNNNDRHHNNLLLTHEHDKPDSPKLMAIDNERCFQYGHKRQVHPGESFPATIHGNNVALQWAAHSKDQVGDENRVKDIEHHVRDWWNTNKHALKKSFEKHVEGIWHEGLREHTSQSFSDRFDYLDKVVNSGHSITQGLMGVNPLQSPHLEYHYNAYKNGMIEPPVRVNKPSSTAKVRMNTPIEKKKQLKISEVPRTAPTQEIDNDNDLKTNNPNPSLHFSNT